MEIVHTIWARTYNDRFISIDGLVHNPNASKVTNQYLEGGVTTQGYVVISFFGRKRRVQRLVAEAFIPNLKNKPEVDHKDANKLNNSYENLRWATRSENVANAVEHGNHNVGRLGEAHPGAKLKHKDVDYIRAFCSSHGRGATAQMARRYDITSTMVYKINKREVWK